MYGNAIATEECAESHVAMTASIVLAVDAEGVELLLVDAFAEVGADVGALGVTTEARIRQGRVALGLGVSCILWSEVLGRV